MTGIKNSDQTIYETTSLTLFIYLFSDNDKPNITTTNQHPLDQVNNVTLTCVPITTDASILGFQWIKDEKRVEGVISETFMIGNNRSSSGNYSCHVRTCHIGKSGESKKEAVIFLCKLMLTYTILVFSRISG